jgi:hypothetical protein
MAAESLLVVTPEVEERLRFETLVGDISSRFVEVPADRVDQQLSLQKTQTEPCCRLSVNGCTCL